MKSLYLLFLAAAVTPAFAQNAPVKSSLNYNRIGVGYSSDDTLKGYNVTASALLGGSFIVSGVYDDVKAKEATWLTGNLAGFGLAYKFNVGPGDLAIGYTYKTGTIAGAELIGVDIASVVASAEQKGFTLNYRQAINSSFEFSVGYSRIQTNYVFGAGATNVYTGDFASLAGLGSDTDNIFTIGARYNLTKNLDVSLSYAFQGKNAGGNKLGVSAGYNF